MSKTLLSSGQVESLFSSLGKIKKKFEKRYAQNGRDVSVDLIVRNKAIYVIVDGKLKESMNYNSVATLKSE